MKFNKYWSAGVGVISILLCLGSTVAFNKFYLDGRKIQNNEAFIVLLFIMLGIIISHFLTGWWAEKSLATENNPESPNKEKKKIYK